MCMHCKILKTFIFLTLILMLASCQEEQPITKSVRFGKINIEANYQKLVVGKPVAEKVVYLLYADLLVETTGVVYLNLDCLVSSINENHSDRIYIDSIASQLTTRYKVEDKARIRVYWSFNKDLDGVRIDKSNLKMNLDSYCIESGGGVETINRQ